MSKKVWGYLVWGGYRGTPAYPYDTILNPTIASGEGTQGGTAAQLNARSPFFVAESVAESVAKRPFCLASVHCKTLASRFVWQLMWQHASQRYQEQYVNLCPMWWRLLIAD